MPGTDTPSWPLRAVAACFALLALSAALHSDQLSWKEASRVLVIQMGVLALYLAYGRRGGQDVVRGYYPQMLAALLLVFIFNQFDPYAAGKSLWWFGLALLLVGTAFLASLAARAGKGLQTVDYWVCGVSGVALLVLVITWGVWDDPLASKNLVTAAKVVGFALIWLTVRLLPPSRPLLRLRSRGAGVHLVSFVFWAASAVFVVALAVSATRLGTLHHEYGKARGLFRNGEYDGALEAYQAVRQLNRTLRIASIRQQYYNDLMWLELQKGAVEAAGRIAAEWYEASGHDDALWHRFGDLYGEAGQWPQAVEAYGRALRTQGASPDVVDGLGWALIELRDRKGLEAHMRAQGFAPATDRSLAFDERVMLAEIWTARGEYGRALGQFEAAAALQPQDPYLRYRIGMTQLQAGDPAAALDSFGSAISLDPLFADAYFRSGLCLERLGDPSSARQMFAKTVELLPQHLAGLSRLSGPQ